VRRERFDYFAHDPDALIECVDPDALVVAVDAG
jgi:hypothetical protein